MLRLPTTLRGDASSDLYKSDVWRVLRVLHVCESVMRFVTCGRATSAGAVNIIECGAGTRTHLLSMCMRHSRINHTSFDDIPHKELRGFPRERLHDAASEFNPVPSDLHALLKFLSSKGGVTKGRMSKMYNWAWEELINLETRLATAEELTPAQVAVFALRFRTRSASQIRQMTYRSPLPFSVQCLPCVFETSTLLASAASFRGDVCGGAGTALCQ